MSTFAKVKVGDRILYHDRGSPTKQYIGKRGTVSDVRNTGSTADVIFDGDSLTTQVSTANIEVISNPDIKVGDMVWIRVTQSRGGSSRCDKTRPHKIKGKHHKWFIVDMNYYAAEDLELAAMPTEIEKALALLKQHGTVTFVPTFKPITVKHINRAYDAVVYEDYVKVGCQRFEFDAIDAVKNAVDEARKARIWK